MSRNTLSVIGFLVLTLLSACQASPAIRSTEVNKSTRYESTKQVSCSAELDGEFREKYGTIEAGTKLRTILDFTIAADSFPPAYKATHLADASSTITLDIEGEPQTYTFPIGLVGILDRATDGFVDSYSIANDMRISDPNNNRIGGEPQYIVPRISLRSGHGVNVIDTDQFNIGSLHLFDENVLSFSRSSTSNRFAVNLTVNETGQSSFLCSTSPGPTNCNDPSFKVVDGVHDIRNYGAVPSTPTQPFDSTLPIKAALQCAQPGETVFVPRGLYQISETLEISGKTLEIVGTGINSGIVQMDARKDLLSIYDTMAPRISDLFLGGRNPKEGHMPALLRMKLVRYGRFDNVVLQGAHTGIALEGSLSNSFYDIKASTNIREPFGGCPDAPPPPGKLVCHNHQWIDSIDYIAPSDTTNLSPFASQNVASNANRYYNAQLEGGIDGFKYDGSLGNGGASFHGGIISTSGENGREGIAFNLKDVGQPFLIQGMHIEANSIILETTSNVTIDTTMVSGVPDTSTSIRKTGRVCLGDGAVFTEIRNSSIEAIEVSPSLVNATPRRYTLSNVRYGTAQTCKFPSAIPTPGANELCLNERSSELTPKTDGCPMTTSTTGEVWGYKGTDAFGGRLGEVTFIAKLGQDSLWEFSHRDNESESYDGRFEMLPVGQTRTVGIVCSADPLEDEAILVTPISYLNDQIIIKGVRLYDDGSGNGLVETDELTLTKGQFDFIHTCEID